MSNINPYSPIQNAPLGAARVHQVSIQPIELLKRSYALIGDQYWLFLGIVLVGLFLGSLVPMGILVGPFLVGIYLCFIQREQGQRVEFATLFKGFDFFMNALVAMLIMIGIWLLVIIPLVIVFMVVMFAVFSGQRGGEPGAAFFLIGLGGYATIIFASILVYIPFLFTFQLIADRGCQAGQAIRESWQGVKTNLVGILLFLLAMMVISIVAAILCYIPLLLLMPIMMGAYYVLYRDVYGPRQNYAFRS